MNKHKLLILDLDETLVYTTPNQRENALHSAIIYIGNVPYYVYARPHLDQFIKVCFDNFKVAIWTAGSESYANVVLKSILPEFRNQFEFVFTSSRCVVKRPLSMGCDMRGNIIIKPLKKVHKRFKISLNNIIVVDDQPSTYSRNYGCAIPVSGYYGAPDDELLCLSRYLTEVAKDCPTEDWRRLEKRNWRDAIEAHITS